MSTPNWQEHYQTKQEAYAAILEALLLNPAVAGDDGFLRLHMEGKWFLIKPKKRKEKMEI